MVLHFASVDTNKENRISYFKHRIIWIEFVDNPYLLIFFYFISYPVSAHIWIRIIRIHMDIKVLLYILKIWIWIGSKNYPHHFDFWILNHNLGPILWDSCSAKSRAAKLIRPVSVGSFIFQIPRLNVLARKQCRFMHLLVGACHCKNDIFWIIKIY